MCGECMVGVGRCPGCHAVTRIYEEEFLYLLKEGPRRLILNSCSSIFINDLEVSPMSDPDGANQALAAESVNSDADVKQEDDEAKEHDVQVKRSPGDSMTKVTVPLLIGITAAVAGFFGAQSGANATLEAQRQQLTSEHNETTRTQREQVYQQYLQAANAYDVASSERYSECISDRGCSTSVAGWQRARFSYQGALNAVYVYGSNEAWRQTHVISSSLPQSLGVNSDDTIPSKVNQNLFTIAYQGFQVIMCLELNPTPQDACH